MLSRRSVRVKAMQLLYMQSMDESLTVNQLTEMYRQSITRSYELYLFHIYLVCRIAEGGTDTRTALFLAANTVAKFYKGLPGLNKLFEKEKFSEFFDQDMVKNLIKGFVESNEFKAYESLETLPEDKHSALLLDLYKYLQTSDLFNDLTEEKFNNWRDDESLVIGAVKKTLKTTTKPDIFKEFEPADDTVKEFGEELLKWVSQENDALLGHIEPVLKNWNADRVATMDMIILKLSLCEIIHFPTIPAKVTINEFIEISKLYSTEKSKDFINGILDRLVKKLFKDGKITKEIEG